MELITFLRIIRLYFSNSLSLQLDAWHICLIFQPVKTAISNSQKLTSSVCKDIKIRQFDVVASNLFLSDNNISMFYVELAWEPKGVVVSPTVYLHFAILDIFPASSGPTQLRIWKQSIEHSRGSPKCPSQNLRFPSYDQANWQTEITTSYM